MKFLAWLIANTAAFLLPMVLAFHILERDLIQERLANPILSTDGDSLGIPLFGVAIFTLLILICINTVGALIWWGVK